VGSIQTVLENNLLTKKRKSVRIYGEEEWHGVQSPACSSNMKMEVAGSSEILITVWAEYLTSHLIRQEYISHLRKKGRLGMWFAGHGSRAV
jgi:hypothetical protein